VWAGAEQKARSRADGPRGAKGSEGRWQLRGRRRARSAAGPWARARQPQAPCRRSGPGCNRGSPPARPAAPLRRRPPAPHLEVLRRDGVEHLEAVLERRAHVAVDLPGEGQRDLEDVEHVIGRGAVRQVPARTEGVARPLRIGRRGGGGAGGGGGGAAVRAGARTAAASRRRAAASARGGSVRGPPRRAHARPAPAEPLPASPYGLAPRAGGTVALAGQLVDALQQAHRRLRVRAVGDLEGGGAKGWWPRRRARGPWARRGSATEALE
jgi:hypothetical protein